MLLPIGTIHLMNNNNNKHLNVIKSNKSKPGLINSNIVITYKHITIQSHTKLLREYHFEIVKFHQNNINNIIQFIRMIERQLVGLTVFHT